MTTILRMRVAARVAAVAALSSQLALVPASPAASVERPQPVRHVHSDPAEALPSLPRPVRAASSGQPSAAAATTPACSSSHPRGFQLLYVHPSDVTSRLSSLQNGFLADAAASQEKVVAESSSAPKRPRFFCGITAVKTSRPSAIYTADPLPQILDDLDAAGYARTDRKYVVWWDGPNHPFACGEGTFADDDRPSPTQNWNNTGPDYALVYKPPGGGPTFCGWTTLLHEIGHTLGSIMHSAPNATANWHCRDENDVMCYEDGPGVTTFEACPGSTMRFDCNGDDYFNPAPASGSYLATHWNTYNSSWLEATSGAGGGSGGGASGVPDTSITVKPASFSNTTTAAFQFTSTVAGSTFACAVDGGSPQPCTSPASFPGLSNGAHTFTVTATAGGQSDPTPATYSWTVDTVAPAVSLTLPNVAIQTSRSFPVQWTATDSAGPVPTQRILMRAASTAQAFGAWSVWKEQSSPGATFIGGAGWTYCFAIEVFDRAGNRAVTPNEQCTAVPLDDRWIPASKFERTSVAGFFDNTASVARQRGATLTLSNIRARYVDMRVQMCRACRYIDVYWNGQRIKQMSLYTTDPKMITVSLASFSSLRTGTLQLYVVSPVIVVDSIGVSQS